MEAKKEGHGISRIPSFPSPKNKQLALLSLNRNTITVIENLETLPNLQELYLGESLSYLMLLTSNRLQQD